MRFVAVFIGMFLLSACEPSLQEPRSDSDSPGDAAPDSPSASGGAIADASGAASGAASTSDGSTGPLGTSSPNTDVTSGPISPAPGGTPASGAVNYYRDIKPILDTKCTQCHVVGGMGPFPLTTYAEVKPLASAIGAAVHAGTMPPWRAAGPLDKYIGDRRLTEAQKRLIASWIDQGALSGEPSQEPPRAPAERRGLPRVDAVLQMQEPYTPQVEPDEYRCFVLDWPYEDTRYITGLDVVPGRRDIVHHAIVYAVDSLQALRARVLDAADAGPGYNCLATDVNAGRWLTSYEPGGYGQQNPGGVGFEIEAGSALILQIHYNTSHAKGPDASRLELMVEKTVSRVGQVTLLYHPAWILGFMPIPAGDRDVVHRWEGEPSGFSSLSSYDVFAVDLHMHTLGKSGTIGIRRAWQSTPEPLLEIHDWAFEWQETYRLREPVRIHPGDEFYVECHFDNSGARGAHGGHGATAPVRDVNWGEGSADEMCLGNVLLAPVN